MTPHRSPGTPALVAALLTTLACRASEAPRPEPLPRPAPPWTLAPELEAATRDSLTAHLDDAVARVEAFFGSPFPEPFEVLVLPDRAAFSASFPPEWGLSQTACWMVAAGVADRLHLLAPDAWEAEACEHDPRDAAHVAQILAHETAHVFHGQHNPTRDFTGAESVGWFAEGLAVLVSGQLESGHRDSAREAVRTGRVPRRLGEAWSGPHRYGVSGTLVELVDQELGRAGLVALLAATHEEEILAALGWSEEQLLARWMAAVEAAS